MADADWRVADGKKMRDEVGAARNLARTGVLGLAVAPLTLALGYPLALLYNVGALARRALAGSATPRRPWPPAVTREPIDLTKPRKPLDKRAFDLVIFGATGFTGGLAAKYVAQQYKDSPLKWAIAGRRKDALVQVRKELCEVNPALADLPIIIADSGSSESLDAMVNDTRVIVSTAGPFQVYGTSLVKACVEHGTSYCDITGEVEWVQVLIDVYDKAARQTGARIVNMAGHDCVPWDLCTLKLAEALKEKGEDVAEVSFFDFLNGAPSGGTLATVVESIPPKVYKSKLGFDPIKATPEGTKSAFKTVNKIQMGPWRDSKHGYTGVFVMAQVMAKCVERSNVLNGYGQNMVYREAEVAPDFFALINRYLEFLPMGLVLALPPLRDRVLPAPGEGPSPSQLQRGFLTLRGEATGTKGSKVSCEIYFDRDPGYFWTARMLVEAGLAIAFTPERMKSTGGILTPASCQGDVLLTRLMDVGLKFRLRSGL